MPSKPTSPPANYHRYPPDSLHVAEVLPFVYVTNWGYRRFMLRLPHASFDVALAKDYCHREGVTLRKKKDCLLLEFDRDDEPGDWEDWDDGSGWMASLTPLRSDLLEGDWRCLYLAWLSGIETESLSDNATEPPVPAGLKGLSAPLGAFANFLQIDTELINVAAAPSESRAANDPPDGALKEWIRSLPVAEKESLLLRIAQGDEPNPRRSLMRSFKEATQGQDANRTAGDATSRRTVTEISEVWQQRLDAKQQRLAEQAEKERERQARAEAKARKKHLDDIASRTSAVWKQVSVWIEKRTPKGYDCAVELLVDLRDAADRPSRTDEFSERLQALRDRHASKPSLIRRLQKSGLG